MKSIIVGRDSNQISVALDDEALEQLITTLKNYQKEKTEARFTVETIGDSIDLVFLPLDVRDKQVQEFIAEKEEIAALKKL